MHRCDAHCSDHNISRGAMKRKINSTQTSVYYDYKISLGDVSLCNLFIDNMSIKMNLLN